MTNSVFSMTTSCGSLFTHTLHRVKRMRAFFSFLLQTRKQVQNFDEIWKVSTDSWEINEAKWRKSNWGIIEVKKNSRCFLYLASKRNSVLLQSKYKLDRLCLRGVFLSTLAGCEGPLMLTAVVTWISLSAHTHSAWNPFALYLIALLNVLFQCT